MINRTISRDIADLHGATLHLTQFDDRSLRIPGTQLYIVPSTTMGEVVKASGLKVYDFALPQPWVQANYWDKGKDTPRGVWSYDAPNQHFGMFVSLEYMLLLIADQLYPTGKAIRYLECFAEECIDIATGADPVNGLKEFFEQMTVDEVWPDGPINFKTIVSHFVLLDEKRRFESEK